MFIKFLNHVDIMKYKYEISNPSNFKFLGKNILLTSAVYGGFSTQSELLFSLRPSLWSQVSGQTPDHRRGGEDRGPEWNSR